jgi:hypothetical protein
MAAPCTITRIKVVYYGQHSRIESVNSRKPMRDLNLHPKEKILTVGEKAQVLWKVVDLKGG